MKKVLFTIFLLIFFLSFSYTNAQLQAPIDGVTIDSLPTDPEPLENTTITLDSYLIDLNSASIVWLSNSVNIAHGIGMKEIKVKAPIAGKKSTISAIIKDSNGREIQKTIILKSGSVDIVWEPINYSTPFYKGKNQFAYQNKIKLIAMPHIYNGDSKELNAKNLVYQWKSGGKYIDGASGYGKQSVIINGGDIPKPIDISLEVYNREQTANATKKIIIEPTDPSVEFYEIDPLYGVFYNKAITKRLTLDNSEITILASPYGFNYLNNALNYIWSINDIEQSNLSKNQSLTLRTKGDTSGASNINLQIRNTKDLLQGISSAFSINFNKKDTSISNASPF